MVSKSITPLALALRLAAGGWVPCRRDHAELLLRLPGVQVEHKVFPTRVWRPLTGDYTYRPRMLFRARLNQEAQCPSPTTSPA